MNLPWLYDAFHAGASDIHWIPEEATTCCFWRIQTKWIENRRYPKGEADKLQQQIRSLAGLPLERCSYPIEGKLSLAAGTVRISIIRSSYGEAMTLRLIPRDDPFPDLLSVGIEPPVIEKILDRFSAPGGLSLIAGSTGSGKSTTALALLKQLRHNSFRIFTLEDPVEQSLHHAHQIQMPDREEEIQNTLRALLRQSPDVIFLGEIRSPESLQMAASAALTGHRILSTIHAADPQGVFDRLTSLGLPPQNQKNLLRMIITQHWDHQSGEAKVKFDPVFNPETFLVLEPESELIQVG